MNRAYWRSPEAYKKLETFDAPGFAFQFLNRNPEFVKDRERLQQMDRSGALEPAEVIGTNFGVGVAEGMAWTANYKRGSDLQIAAIACVVLGLVVSRVVIAERSPFFTLNDLLNHTTNPAVSAYFQLRLIPDMLFAALAIAIPFVRFR